MLDVPLKFVDRVSSTIETAAHLSKTVLCADRKIPTDLVQIVTDVHDDGSVVVTAYPSTILLGWLASLVYEASGVAAERQISLQDIKAARAADMMDGTA